MWTVFDVTIKVGWLADWLHGNNSFRKSTKVTRITACSATHSCKAACIGILLWYNGIINVLMLMLA